MCNKKRQSGFTLVELAIVIVIIGFIVAGIAAGSSLIKQAQIRSIMSDFSSFQVGYNNFLGRYNAVPGDFSSGESYWPAGATGCAATGIQCSGNGNGLIEFSVSGAATGASETRLAWRQLVLAGMLSAGITQITVSNQLGDNAMILATRAPISKISGAGYVMAGYWQDGANSRLIATINSPWPGTGKNSVYIGRAAVSTGDTTGILSHGALNPDDAFQIDQKMDDGSISGVTFIGANTGVIRTTNAANAAAIGAGSNTCIGDTSTADVRFYRIGVTNALQFEGCLLGFQLN